MLDTTIRPYILQLICQKQYPNNRTKICLHLHLHRKEEDSVQKEASLYFFLYRFAANLPSIFTGLFAGVWSDKHGHRLPMIGSCFGTVIAALIYIGSIFFKDSSISIWAVLFGTLVQGFFGKAVVFTTAVNCLINKESDDENTTKHTGMLFSMNYFGQCFGALLTGVIKDSFVPYLTVIGMVSSAGFVVFVFVKNQTHSLKENASNCHDNDNCHEQGELKKKTIKDIVVLNDIKDLKAQDTKSYGSNIDQSIANDQKQPIKTKCLLFEALRSYLNVFTRKRKNIKPSFLALLMFLVFANGCDIKGVIDVFLLFITRSPFSWTDSLYSFYIASETITIGIVLMVLVPILSKKFKVSDFNLIVLGFLCKIIRFVATGFCRDTWVMFVLLVVWSLNACIICLRSVIGKCVEPEELGKIYSIYSIAETLPRFIGSVMYMSIYSVTVSFDPRITFFLMGFLNVVMLIIVVMSRRNFDRACSFEMTPVIVDNQSSQKYTVGPDK